MSWDVKVLNSKEKVPLDRDNENASLPSFGTSHEFAAKISLLYPDTDWTDINYAHLDINDFIGHIYTPGGKLLENWVMFHVYGGENPTGVIANICLKYGWQAFDTVSETYINLKNPSSDSFDQFVSWRQKIAGQLSEKPRVNSNRWWKLWK